jgi:hypothetical protein
MLFMNNPDAFKTIIESQHQTNGLHITTATDVTQTTETKRPSSKPRRWYSRLAPLTTAN